MTILVVGGGVFVGRSIAEAALGRGHLVSVFNRGRSSEPPPGVEWLKGDRDRDLGVLGGRDWDVVIDACGYFPRQVSGLLHQLRGRMGRYVFISSVSAYADHSRQGINETHALAGDVDATGPEVTPANYGPMKAMCERAAAVYAEKPPLLIRPGIIAGPRDPTGRLPYWTTRLERGGEVLAPGTPGNPLQLVDARDLGLWTVRMAELGASGPYNAVGPKAPYSWGEMLRDCAAAAGTDPRVTWVGDRFITEHKVDERASLPLYVPEGHPRAGGMFRVDGSRAFLSGLEPRPMAETIADTLAWTRTPLGRAGKQVGLLPERERELLDAWHLAARS